MFVLVYSSAANGAKSYSTKKYYIPKSISKKFHDVITTGKNFYDQPIDSDIKWHDEIRKLTTRQGEDYTSEYLLDLWIHRKSLLTSSSWFE